nr:digestive organ expansion factor homolog [Zootoca vivipara]
MGKRKVRRQQQLISSLSKKQKKHLKDFGEEHPFYDRVSGKEKPTQICELTETSEQSSSESDTENDSEEASVYHKLLATLKTAPYSDSEDDEDESEGGSNKGDAEVGSDEDEEGEGEMEDEDNDSNAAHPPESDQEAPLQKNSQEEPGDPEASSDLKHEATEEFTDVQHESEFSLETNFIEEECGDPSADGKENSGSADIAKDPFKCHVDEELEEKQIEKILACSKSTNQVKWPALGQLVFSSKLEKFGMVKADKEVDLKRLHLRKPLGSAWPKVNSPFLSKQVKSKDQPFTPLQKELFCIMNSYKDLFYPERTALSNGEEVRQIYCLHALNHVLKANAQVLGNNAKRRDQKTGTDDDSFRDQGLTRPKVKGFP